MMEFVGPGYNTNTKRFENTPVDSVVPFLHGSESPVPEQTAADNNNALILYSSGSLSVMLCYVMYVVFFIILNLQTVVREISLMFSTHVW
jgi:hypothetical protein